MDHPSRPIAGYWFSILPDGAMLKTWVAEARRLCVKTDRAAAGDLAIGEVLAHSPTDPDAAPCHGQRVAQRPLQWHLTEDPLLDPTRFVTIPHCVNGTNSGSPLSSFAFLVAHLAGSHEPRSFPCIPCMSARAPGQARKLTSERGADRSPLAIATGAASSHRDISFSDDGSATDDADRTKGAPFRAAAGDHGKPSSAGGAFYAKQTYADDGNRLDDICRLWTDTTSKLSSTSSAWADEFRREVDLDRAIRIRRARARPPYSGSYPAAVK
jgi:hypothetical protein